MNSFKFFKQVSCETKVLDAKLYNFHDHAKDVNRFTIVCLQVCLDGISNLLTTASKVDQMEQMCCAIEACGGLDLIEKLQEHSNEKVYNMALAIIDDFFSAEVKKLAIGLYLANM